MSKLSKKEKGWVVFSVIWFLIICAIAVSEGTKITDPFGFDDTPPYFDAGVALTIVVVFNIPLIIGWGRWWMKRE